MSKDLDVMTTKLTKNNIYDYVDFDLFSRINPYIYSAIVKFIKEYMEVMNNKAIEENVPAEQVVNILLTEIKKIEFERPYAERKFKMEKDGFKIDQSDFKKFIGEKIPALVKVEEFINKIDFPKPKNKLLETLEKIQNEINDYKNPNKKGLIKTFNTTMNELKENLEERKISNGEALQKTRDLLTNLQSGEDDHYRGLFFFANYRKGHSSLQPHITAAITLFDAFETEHNIVQAPRLGG